MQIDKMAKNKGILYHFYGSVEPYLPLHGIDKYTCLC